MDFFEALEALPEKELDFFDELKAYSPEVYEPRVGDVFSITGYGYGVGRDQLEIIEIEPKRESYNNITYVRAGSVPDKQGYYMDIGCISTNALQKYQGLEVLYIRKRGQAAHDTTDPDDDTR